MLTEFASAKTLVGIKQSTKAVVAGSVKRACAARNADPELVERFSRLCGEYGVELFFADTMEELGHACGINVGAAVAVLLK